MSGDLSDYHIRKNTVITPNQKSFSTKQHIPGEVLCVGLLGFVMTMMSTISNAALNHMVAGYSDTAIAGMGIAKKTDLLAYTIAQGMTQGTLPLIGYNYTSGNSKRLKAAIKAAFASSFLVACAGTVLLWTLATPISRCFIANAETVRYGQHFLKIICLACPMTAVNFMVITVFQAIGKKGTAALPIAAAQGKSGRGVHACFEPCRRCFRYRMGNALCRLDRVCDFRGPDRAAAEKAERRLIQKKHMANMQINASNGLLRQAVLLFKAVFDMATTHRQDRTAGKIFFYPP